MRYLWMCRNHREVPLFLQINPKKMMHWTEVNSSVDIQLGLLKFLSITPFISKGHRQKNSFVFTLLYFI